MKGYWIKFEDGSAGYCQGVSEIDAVQIAESLTGKRVANREEYKWKQEKNPAVKRLPYPAHPVIWQLDHPITGKCPAFCIRPNECAGSSACPQSYSCTE